MPSREIRKKLVIEWLRASDHERARREGGAVRSPEEIERSAELLVDLMPEYPTYPMMPGFPMMPIGGAGGAPVMAGGPPAPPGGPGVKHGGTTTEHGGTQPKHGGTQPVGSETGYGGTFVEDDDGDDPHDRGYEIYGEEIDIEIVRPLIFVPGIMGSALSLPMATGPHLPVWPPRQFKLSAGLQQLSHNSNKVPTGLFPGTYTELLAWLERMDYVLNVNFWIHAYDWTQSNRASGDGLAALIETILSAHSEWENVDIICHSMGGLVTRSAYVNSGAAGRIKRVIYLASPHFGAPKAYFVVRPGVTTYGGGATGFFREQVVEAVWDAAFKDEGDADELEDNLKRLAGQLQSVYELLPDEFYLDAQHAMVTVEEMNWVQLHPYTMPVYQPSTRPVTGVTATYYQDVCSFPAGLQAHVRNAMDFKRSLGRAIPPGNPTDTLIIYADTLETYDTVEKNNHFFASDFEAPLDSGQAGDETVPTDSARANLPPGDAKLLKVQDGHSTLPDNPATLKAIHQFLGAPS